MSETTPPDDADVRHSSTLPSSLAENEPPAEQEVPAPASSVLVPPPMPCWRCGKESPTTAPTCPYCRARLTAGPTAEPKRRARSAATLVLRLLIIYSVMLLLSLIFGLTLVEGRQRDADADAQGLVVALEIVDSALVILAIVWIGRPAGLARAAWTTRALIWLAAVPCLALALAANSAYHAILQSYINPPWWLLVNLETEEATLGNILLVCVQPAVVEELFFRYLALGVLLRVGTAQSAVWISAVMFGLAHIYVPLSVPYLVGLGLLLGYLRVASGGMLLPMLVHFVHNGVVLSLLG